jgi:hypothetical protein
MTGGRGTSRRARREGDRACRVIAPQGVVTLWTEEREKTTAFAISSSRNHLAPGAHRRGAEGAMRSGRGEMALDVEGVVDGGVG